MVVSIYMGYIHEYGASLKFTARYLFPTTKHLVSSKYKPVKEKLTAFKYRDFHFTPMSCASCTRVFLFELVFSGFYFTLASPDLKAYDEKVEVEKNARTEIGRKVLH